MIFMASSRKCATVFFQKYSLNALFGFIINNRYFCFVVM
nr:MAG TPA: hypothetical protein [Caudoviricetes sp.]